MVPNVRFTFLTLIIFLGPCSIRGDTKKSWIKVDEKFDLNNLKSIREHRLKPLEDTTESLSRTTRDISSSKIMEDLTMPPSTSYSVETEVKDNNQSTDADKIVKNGLKLLIMGRGRKNNWIERIVPLFILPFLIQSAIVPFIVQTIKLLLLKSLFVGKTALLLFFLGVLRNMSKHHRASGSPYFFKDGSGLSPDERIYSDYIHQENGYRVDGRPEFISRHQNI